MLHISFLDFLRESGEDRVNFGEDFEQMFYRSLNSFSSQSDESGAGIDQQYKNIAKQFLEDFVLKDSVQMGKRYDFFVKNESQNDKRRHYLADVNGKIVLNRETSDDIGKYITDFTVNYKGKTTYISLKANNTLCWGTIGLKTLGLLLGEDKFKQFMEDMFEPVGDESIDDIINALKDGLEEYYDGRTKKTKIQRSQIEDKLSIKLRMTDSLRMLIRKLIGHGYVYVWYSAKNNKHRMFEMTREKLDVLMDAFDDEISLEPFCKTSKIAYFKFNNKYIDNPRLELKDNHGNEFPDQIKFNYTDIHSYQNK